MERGTMDVPGNSFRSRYVVWSFLAILAGGFVYVLFRPVEPIFFNWLGAIGFENWLAMIREKSLSLNQLMPAWLVYSLPNGLWAFAYTILILAIWKGSHSLIKYVWFLTIPVLIFGFELLQLTGDLPGTFCVYDLLWGAAGITLGIFTVYRNPNYIKP